MKVSYQWLRALAPDLTLSPEEAAERLASLGFPVEDREELGAGLEGLVVGRVLQVREHPDADRLVLCDVDAGDGKPVQVVCGAPTVVEGAFYPFAPVGSSLPGGMEIRKAKLRGKVSEGMLCSEKEVGLGPDASGIMELTGDFRPGQPLTQALALDDVRLDVEVTSNRPDLLSHRGIAREIAPGGDGGISLPRIPGEDREAGARVDALDAVTDREEASGAGVTVRIEAPELCGAYLGLVLSGVKVGPSPGWLQARLRAAGARPINNVVDATNYVLLELGHPLHAFDLDELEERTIVVRRAREGETIRTLDGVERELAPEMLAICDAVRPVAVAGVMGGEDSEVDEGTTDVLLECALFTPGPTRATRKALGMSTDASYRFERGVDPEGLREAILRTARIILVTAGGEVAGPLLEVRPESFRRNLVPLRPARVKRVLGIPFSEERIRDLLSPLGFVIQEEDASGRPDVSQAVSHKRTLQVEVPGFRSWDVTREVDLVEELARTHGYDEFPDTLGAYRPGTVPDHPLFLLEDGLRAELVARGLLEAHTLAFAGEGEGEVEILNPVSQEERFLRSELLPSLLRRVGYNLARGNRDVRLFELATTFRPGPRGELPLETPHLAVVLHGHADPAHWSGETRAVDLWDLKGILEGVATRIPGRGWHVVPAGDDAGPHLEPSAAFHLVDEEGTVRGRGGRIRNAALDLPPWAGEVLGAEVALPSEPGSPAERRYEPLPLHPGVERDLALLVDGGCPVGSVLELLRREGGDHLRDLQVFDVYEGAGIPEGKRSVAVRLHFRAGDRTLTDREVDTRMDELARILQEELGVGIRGR
jgi:phenylalanyl-tRNA synthetase beta chain